MLPQIFNDIGDFFKFFAYATNWRLLIDKLTQNGIFDVEIRVEENQQLVPFTFPFINSYKFKIRGTNLLLTHQYYWEIARLKFPETHFFRPKKYASNKLHI